MKRLTTNCPDNNLDAALNLFYIKDSETWVRGGLPRHPALRFYPQSRKDFAAGLGIPNG